jgi:hypothetical protein
MRGKYWWIFGAIQLMGLLAAFEGLYLFEEPIWWGLSLLLLLPGTLISFPFRSRRNALATLDRVRNRRARKRASLRHRVVSRRQVPQIKLSGFFFAGSVSVRKLQARSVSGCLVRELMRRYAPASVRITPALRRRAEADRLRMGMLDSVTSACFFGVSIQ